MWSFDTQRIRLGGDHFEYYYPTRVGHIQMGMCRGSIKGGTSTTEQMNVINEDDRLCFNRTQMWQEFLDSCPKKEEAWLFLWQANWSLLKRAIAMSPKSPICIPRPLGGIGFPKPPSSLVEICERRKPTKHQLAVARFCLESPMDRTVQGWSRASSSKGLHELSNFRSSEFFEALNQVEALSEWTTDPVPDIILDSPIPAIKFACLDEYNDSVILDLRRSLTTLCHRMEKVTKMSGRFLMSWEEAWKNSNIVLRTSRFLL